MTLGRIVFFLTVVVVSSGEDGDAGPALKCHPGAKPLEGDLLLDKLMKRLLTSEAFQTVALPRSHHKTTLAGFRVTVDIYNGTISGLSGVKRLGRNHLISKRNDNLEARFGIEVDKLNISLSLKIGTYLMNIYVDAEVFFPATKFVIAVKQINESLKITHFTLNNSEALDLRFRLVGRGTYFFNLLKWPLQVYVRRRVNRSLRSEVLRAARQQLEDISRRYQESLKGTYCVNCTMLDVAFSDAIHKYQLEPANLPASTSNMVGSLLATIVTVKIMNATVDGLSRTRQAGDVIARVNKCGAFAFLDLMLHNLTASFALHASTWLVSVDAIVAASVSARVIVKVVEKNETLVLEQLVVNVTDRVNITVTPMSAMASMASLVLPTRLIGNLLKAHLPILLNDTIQSGLTKLNEYAHNQTKNKA
ncbi:uncharacterized protein LOC144169168 [Haemaphysalis longicornis]